MKPKQRNAVECLLKKDEVLAVLPTGCAFSRIAEVGNSTFSWKFSSTDTKSGSVEFIFRTWPLGFGRNFLHFFLVWIISWEKIKKTAALFLTWDDLLTHYRYLRRWTSDWPHLSIYRSINKWFLHMFFWALQLRACKVFQTDWTFLWLQFQLVWGLEIKSHLRLHSYLKM